MILREISIDLPYIADNEKITKIMENNQCSRDEAIQTDYEANWKEKRRAITNQTRCICSMFERLMGKVVTKSCSKLIIECENEDNHSMKNYSGFCETKIAFDYNAFASMNKLEKKQMTLQMIMKGLNRLIEQGEILQETFSTVHDQIVELNYNNVWEWRKTCKSPNKEYVAALKVEHDVYFVKFLILIRDKKGNLIAEKELMLEEPHEFVYAYHMGELVWINEKEVALLNKSGDQKWIIRIP